MSTKDDIKRLEDKIDKLTALVSLVFRQQNGQDTELALRLNDLESVVKNNALFLREFIKEVEERVNKNIVGLTEEELFDLAKEAVISAGKASTSYIQRRLRIGYAQAVILMEELEAKGIVGPANGAKPRDVLSKPDGDGPEEKGVRVMII